MNNAHLTEKGLIDRKMCENFIMMNKMVQTACTDSVLLPRDQTEDNNIFFYLLKCI